MYVRISAFFLTLAFLVSASTSNAQSMDYLRHNKIFNLCSYERECSGCYDCEFQKYTVKIKNLVDKKIKKVSYVYYSEARNKVITKEGVIIGGLIDFKQIGHINMCLPDGKHWAISEIVYDDDSKQAFVVKDRLATFYQEPDECDCNKQPNNYTNPNIGKDNW